MLYKNGLQHIGFAAWESKLSGKVRIRENVVIPKSHLPKLSEIPRHRSGASSGKDRSTVNGVTGAATATSSVAKASNRPMGWNVRP